MEGSQTEITEHTEATTNAANDLYAAYLEFTKKEEELKNELLNDIQKIVNQTMADAKQFAKECKFVSQEMTTIDYLAKYLHSKNQRFMEYIFSQESQQAGSSE